MRTDIFVVSVVIFTMRLLMALAG